MQIRLILLVALLAFALLTAAWQRPTSADAFVAEPGKVKFASARECAAQMTVPKGFEVKPFASEPDVVNPIAIDFDSRGRVWVLECLEYPRKAPKDQKGRDRIKILEDVDGDGIADKVSTFADGLNLATGMAVGHGGVFVGEPPELIFLEDTDGDDKADKRTVLLDGWGYQDTHETLNSFLWGPDGWLYGCHGVFTDSLVGKPGVAEKDRVFLNAAIWRYHPNSRQFELFAEGTSNPWGFDYDENGSGFLTACVIPHLFHMVPNGVYIRQAGQNRNPFNFGQIKEICDHVHYFGPTPHGGNKDPRSLNLGGGHAHSGCLIYQGGAFPEEWHGRVLMNNIHGSRINSDILKKNGSTYIGSHGPDLLVANDGNFRAIQLRTGPDGSVYLIDWYDPQICHNTDPAIWDRGHGRVYKLIYKGPKDKPKPGGGLFPGKMPLGNSEREPKHQVEDLARLTSDELVERLKHPNSWQWRMALLLLQERADKKVAPRLKEMVARSDDYRHSLRALWALNNLGALEEEFARKTLEHPNAWLRVWAVRLLAQMDARLDDATWKELVRLARTDPSPDVRMHLASACIRVRRHRNIQEVARELMLHDADAKDPIIPLMIWLAIEPNVPADYKSLLDWLASKASNHPLVREEISPRTFRRLGSTGELKHLEAALACLQQFDGAARVVALDGLLAALAGRRVEPPPAWTRGEIRLVEGDQGDLRRRVRRLGVHFGDPSAVAEMEKIAVDPKQAAADRIEAIQALGLARLASSVEPLISLAVDEPSGEVKKEALRMLAGFDNLAIPEKMLGRWSHLPDDLKREVVGLLSGRAAWAELLLDAIQDKKVDRHELTENHVRQILAFGNEALSRKVEQAWGKLRDQTPQKVADQLARFRKQLAELPADRQAGRAVFEKNCMVCHRLFDKGSAVGPELTGGNRRDVEYLLVSILDPNRVVGRDYYTAVVLDKAGRLHTGLLQEEAPQRVVLKGENAQLNVIPRDEIARFKIEERSLMPEGLPDSMSEEEFRNLIAFLLEDPFLTQGMIAGPFKMALDDQGPIEKAGDPLKAPDVKWKHFHVGPSGLLDMGKLEVLGPPTDSTAYVVIDVNSPRQVKTTLELAADDDVKVWLNGKMVFRRAAALHGHRLEVELARGSNRFLFKVRNVYGPSSLRARLTDPNREFEVLKPKLE